MWFCFRSTYFFLECFIGVLDMFTFTSAQLTTVKTTSERSTPKPLPLDSSAPTNPYRRTRYENLNFWSGESLTKSWKEIDKDCKKQDHEHKHHDDELSGRRNFGSTLGEEQEKSTKLLLPELETTDEPSDTSSTEQETDKKIRKSKINGYTLLQDMRQLLNTLDKKINTSVATIAKTVEVHDIVLCKLSNTRRNRRDKHFRAWEGVNKYVDETPQKKIILIVHGLSPMGFQDVPCLARKNSFHKLLKLYANQLDKFDIFLIPMGNPDGIADETLFMWNKNKAPQEACSGVAVDRNFDVQWNKSHDIHSCSHQYPGTAPFSEPESRAIADLIHYYNHKIVAYIHVHGASHRNIHKGDAVLFPRGYMDEPPDDKYTDISTAVDEAMKNAGFKVYGVTVTSLYQWYGKVSGTSVDYATTVYGIPYGLEFVMQSWGDAQMHNNILMEVWSRVIDVVFDNIFKSTQPSVDSQ